ncbi:MAG: alpha/beta hydrolase [Bacteroidota bacterium]
MKNVILPSILLLSFFCISCTAWGQKQSAPFEFQFEGKTLHGLIETPMEGSTDAIVIIIPGYGRTNFVEGGWYTRIRTKLVESGLTVVLWDKMGCGKSEGVFDAQQPVANSADEAVAAIKALKQQGIQGVDKIGLWGLSRAGWIAPLINSKYPIDFWISVSGTNDKENFGYLLKSNLIIEGKSEAEAERLYNAWMLAHKIYCTGGSYEEYFEARLPVLKDATCVKIMGYQPPLEMTEEGRQKHINSQKSYLAEGHFDEESGLWVYIDDFDQILEEIDCPVLAIFGENDSQVDWRLTKQLYEETIGKSEKADLITKVFPQCNHSLMKCKTCGYREDLSDTDWEVCDDYYKTMATWLKDKGIVK